MEIFIILICTLIILLLIILIFRRLFKEYILNDQTGSCVLSGQLKCGFSSALLPNPLGRHTYTIKVTGGQLRLNHHTYNPDGGTWTIRPAVGEQEFLNLNDNSDNIIAITVRESFGYPDKIEIVNLSFWHDTKLSYKMD
jgi:hypothetical protein